MFGARDPHGPSGRSAPHPDRAAFRGNPIVERETTECAAPPARDRRAHFAKRHAFDALEWELAPVR